MIEGSTKRVIADQGERAFVVHSTVSTPIKELSFLRKALLFAELSQIAYNDPDEARRGGVAAGFPDVSLYDRDGSQAYRFRNEYDCVIACRGTELNEWNDIRADANTMSVLAETVGRVHRGFKREVDDLWPMIETALMDNEHSLYFCGHSLGGAMATICAARCQLSHIPSLPMELFTYGSPRVGDQRYISHVQLDHYRFVNNNDIVTRVPPVLFGYRHCGDEVYLDRNGRIRKLGIISKRRDRWQGFLRGLRRMKVDHFSDHSIARYIEGIVKAVSEEDKRINLGGEAKRAAEYSDIPS